MPGMAECLLEFGKSSKVIIHRLYDSDIEVFPRFPWIFSELPPQLHSSHSLHLPELPFFRAGRDSQALFSTKIWILILPIN